MAFQSHKRAVYVLNTVRDSFETVGSESSLAYVFINQNVKQNVQKNLNMIVSSFSLFP